MKKFLTIILLSIFTCGCAFAITDEQKSQITANRQVYHTKRKILSKQLDKVRAEYMNISEDTTLDNDEKMRKCSELEVEILRINQEKVKLKSKYNKDKKAIKNKK